MTNLQKELTTGEPVHKIYELWSYKHSQESSKTKVLYRVTRSWIFLSIPCLFFEKFEIGSKTDGGQE